VTILLPQSKFEGRRERQPARWRQIEGQDSCRVKRPDQWAAWRDGRRPGLNQYRGGAVLPSVGKIGTDAGF
jgi:hypothetical protein